MLPPDASAPTMAETTKLQLFVKVLGRLGWRGCSVFLYRLGGMGFPVGVLPLWWAEAAPHRAEQSQAGWGRSSHSRVGVGGIR